jgi:hypothetical protein
MHLATVKVENGSLIQIKPMRHVPEAFCSCGQRKPPHFLFFFYCVHTRFGSFLRPPPLFLCCVLRGCNHGSPWLFCYLMETWEENTEESRTKTETDSWGQRQRKLSLAFYFIWASHLTLFWKTRQSWSAVICKLEEEIVWGVHGVRHGRRREGKHECKVRE